jgi:hypothetical protein
MVTTRREEGVYANCMRLRSDIGRKTMCRRGELVERSYAQNIGRGD